MELDLCFDIIYQHTKFELNRYSLFKLLSGHQILITDGQTHGQG